MIPAWHGRVLIDGERSLEVSLIGEEDQHHIPADSTLRFVSVVETSRIPLFLLIGKAYHVTTSSTETEAWLSALLLLAGHHEGYDGTAWWQTARSDSPLGILVAVEHAHGWSKSASLPSITELLFYAAREEQSDRLRVCALPLCSDILKHEAFNEPTPPQSPQGSSTDIEPRFWPIRNVARAQTDDVVNLPPVRKRKTVADAFDEATERRKRARRSGGVGVAAAASRAVSNETLPTLKHRRSISNNQSSLHTRPASRASSVTSVCPTTAREVSLPAQSKRSSLARVQSAPGVAVSGEEASLEAKNKEMIIKVVMAGMRLYGLVQSKMRKSRANSTVPTPAIDTDLNELETERKNDEEYKLLYHQVYKGTCFAFRQHIATKTFAVHMEALRETVDKFLSIHCNDPLLSASMRADDEYTPGGRKAFGSATVQSSSNPFLMAPVAGDESKNNTPCGHKMAASRNPA